MTLDLEQIKKIEEIRARWVGPSFNLTFPNDAQADIAWLADTLTTLLKGQMEWKPIETAPTDGTFVLVTGPMTNGKPPYVEVNHFYRGKWTIVHMHDYGEPTHWMPRPEPFNASQPQEPQS